MIFGNAVKSNKSWSVISVASRNEIRLIILVIVFFWLLIVRLMGHEIGYRISVCTAVVIEARFSSIFIKGKEEEQAEGNGRRLGMDVKRVNDGLNLFQVTVQMLHV